MKWLKGYKLSDSLLKQTWYYDEIKDFRMDTNFVLIRTNPELTKVELAVVTGKPVEHEGKKVYEITHILTGKKPQDIYWALAKLELVTLPEHFAYIGKELQKAFTCLENRTIYIQP